MDPSQFLADHTAEVEPLVRDGCLAWWGLNTTGSKEDAERSREIRERIARIYANADDYALLREWDEAGAGPGAIEQRQIRLLRLDYAGAQKDEETIRREAELSTRLQQTFANYRPRVGGREVGQGEIDRILRDETDGALRRQAWEASQAIGGEVEADLLDLVGIRNRVARDLGYRDYYEMSLTLSEIDEATLYETLDELEARTDAPFAQAKEALDAELAARFGVPASELMPWHYADPFFQQAPASGGLNLDPWFEEADLEALTVRTYDGLGLDVRSLLENSDLYPRDGKNQHAFCINIDREGDVRVLANVQPTERWMSTLLHEFGHAVYDRYISPDLPFLLRRPAHSLMTEAVAMLMQRLSQDATWLSAIAGVDPAEAGAAAGKLAEGTRLAKLIMVRWMLVMCRFERALYGDADLGRNGRWWELKERLQLLRRPEGRDAPDWAAKIHVAIAPVYYQNYLLGELVASQLEGHLRSVSPRGEIADSRAVGRALVDRLFRPGRLRPWPEALVHATGEALSPRHFLAQYSI